MSDMTELRKANPNWFSKENKRFFGDVSYRTMRNKGDVYLVRSTYAWSDMFGGKKTLHYCINYVSKDYKIGNLIDKRFKDLDEVKDYIKGE